MHAARRIAVENGCGRRPLLSFIAWVIGYFSAPVHNTVLPSTEPYCIDFYSPVAGDRLPLSPPDTHARLFTTRARFDLGLGRGGI